MPIGCLILEASSCGVAAVCQCFGYHFGYHDQVSPSFDSLSVLLLATPNPGLGQPTLAILG
jgi:hypothetical protein